MDKNKKQKRTKQPFEYGAQILSCPSLLPHFLSLLGASLPHPLTIFRSFLMSVLLPATGPLHMLLPLFGVFPSSLHLIKSDSWRDMFSTKLLLTHLTRPNTWLGLFKFYTQVCSLITGHLSTRLILQEQESFLFCMMIITITSVHYQLLSRWWVNILSMTEWMNEESERILFFLNLFLNFLFYMGV